MKHLLSRIEKMMPGFSKGQRRIAQYIEDHYDKAAFMTASKLGATVGVSESTVVRFATEVGYEGYPQLQKAMQEMIRNKLTSVQRIEVTSNRIGDADVLDSVLNQDIDKIRRTLEETSHKDFYEAVDAIVSARKIYILAARSASALRQKKRRQGDCFDRQPFVSAGTAGGFCIAGQKRHGLCCGQPGGPVKLD